MWTLIVCGLRLPELGNSLWLDELHTGWVVAADSWSELSRRARLGNQAPLWFYLPWLAERVCGSSEFALRLPSLLAGGLLIPALYWATYRATRCHPAALVAAVLAGCDSHFLFYAREARGYATVQLVGVLHLTLLLARIDGDRRAAVRVGWWLSGATLFYLHYTTALIFPWEWLALVFAPHLKRDAPPEFDSAMFESSAGDGAVAASRYSMRSRITAAALDIVVLTAACLPALPHVREIAARRDDWAEFLSAENVWRVLPWAGYLGAAAAGLAVVVFARRSSRDQPLYWLPRIEPLVALTAVSVGPGLVASLATRGGVAHLLLYRYLIVPACALPILAAATVAVSPGRAARGFVAFVLVGAALAGNSYFTHAVAECRWPAERNERWRELIADLNRQHADQPTDRRPILLCGAMVEDRRLAPGAPGAQAPDATLVDFCRFPLRSLYRLQVDDARVIPLATMSARRLTDEQRRQLLDAGGARLIVRGDEHLTAEIVSELKAELAPPRTSSSSDRHQVRATSPPKPYGDLQFVEIQIAGD